MITCFSLALLLGKLSCCHWNYGSNQSLPSTNSWSQQDRSLMESSTLNSVWPERFFWCIACFSSGMAFKYVKSLLDIEVLLEQVKAEEITHPQKKKKQDRKRKKEERMLNRKLKSLKPWPWKISI